jgi:hypothetical protein
MGFKIFQELSKIGVGVAFDFFLLMMNPADLQTI